MRFLLCAIVTLSASLATAPTAPSYFIIWNVGQGQWVTEVQPRHCRHFDVGGEFFPWQKILQLCQNKENFIYLSHWDWDHIGALAQSSFRRLRSSCLALPPLGRSSGRKNALIDSLSACSRNSRDVFVWTPLNSKDSNSQSRVLFYKNVLIPGDSPSAQERIWKELAQTRDIRILVLGHHGSKTSTSEELLRRLPRLQMAISSARWARYKHPHSLVEHRLNMVRTPLLRTEDWGNIWLGQ